MPLAQSRRTEFRRAIERRAARRGVALHARTPRRVPCRNEWLAREAHRVLLVGDARERGDESLAFVQGHGVVRDFPFELALIAPQLLRHIRRSRQTDGRTSEAFGRAGPVPRLLRIE